MTIAVVTYKRNWQHIIDARVALCQGAVTSQGNWYTMHIPEVRNGWRWWLISNRIGVYGLP